MENKQKNDVNATESVGVTETQELNKQYQRMSGLCNTVATDSLKAAAWVIMNDLKAEGFDKEEIANFIGHIAMEDQK